MTDDILFLIDEIINKKNDEAILKISLKLKIDNSQTKIFVKYFHKFNILSSILDSEYANYFNKISLTDLKEKDELTNENFALVISIFIKEKRKNKKLYYINFQTEDDIKLQILILSKLDYASFKYDISYINESIFKNNLNIFKYITSNNYYNFLRLRNELINNLIDTPSINYIRIKNYKALNNILKYSRLYPNRIKYLELYFSEDFNEYDKLKELIELNKESLINYPHNKIKYLISLKNAYIINLKDFTEKVDFYFNLTKITTINLTLNYGYKNDSMIINIINKCPNIEKIYFGYIPSKNLFNILKNINYSKIKSIYGTCVDIERNYDWTPVFEKLPLLEKLCIEEEHYDDLAYQIFPIFKAEHKRLAFPLLEQLIRNYLNGSPDRDISLIFHHEFDQFWDYFKNKKDITSRISRIYGNDINNDTILDSYFKLTISDNIDKIMNYSKYYYCIVESNFNFNNILEIIKRNKIEYLFILNNVNINFNELKKCNDLKFVFDKTTKVVLFRNKLNNILEKI